MTLLFISLPLTTLAIEVKDDIQNEIQNKIPSSEWKYALLRLKEKQQMLEKLKEFYTTIQSFYQTAAHNTQKQNFLEVGKNGIKAFKLIYSREFNYGKDDCNRLGFFPCDMPPYDTQ